MRASYVGQSALGFMFSRDHSVGYVPMMDKYVGQVGKIVLQNSTCVRIVFEDRHNWSYPIELIHKHLIIKKPMNLSELKELYAYFNNDRTKVENAISSINGGYICLQEIIDVNYLYDGQTYYSGEDYVETRDNDIIPMGDAFYCEGLDEWVNYEDTSIVYEGRDEIRYSDVYIRRSDFTLFEGNYYDDEALDRHEIIWCEDIGEYRHSDDAYWDDENECWLSEMRREEFVRGYHDGSYQSIDFTKKPKYRIGYEIEKEDEIVRNSICIDEFEEVTNCKWRKERDGSLCDVTGYELISPTFELDIKKIFEHIEGNEQLVAHINAETSYGCGGHIHLSETGLNGNELFDKIKGYTPLFYALYYGRVNKTYAKGKSNRDLENENEKYQAIKIHHDRVEFRIISAVPNIKTLKWRTELMMMILKNPTDDVIKAYFNVDTKFTKLLKETYSDEKLLELKQRFINFTREFENINIIKN
jgi:hypothetical protein